MPIKNGIWEKPFPDDFARCEKCAGLDEDQEDYWCDPCKQNFAYIWKLENMSQTLQAGMDKVSKILLGLDYVIDPDKRRK